ncbi:hypothetical protein PG984_010201 [Apiospora sp. TS-2023a]
MSFRHHQAILQSRAALTIRQAAYEGLAYVLLCQSLYGIFCFHIVVLSLFFAAIQSSLVVQVERGLGSSFEEKEDPESGRCGPRRHRDNVQLRWIIENWCYVLGYLTACFPDVESWLLYRRSFLLVFGQQQQQPPFLTRSPRVGPKPVSGLSLDETQQSQFLLAEFRAGRHQPCLPRSGDLFCLYVAKVD